MRARQGWLVSVVTFLLSPERIPVITRKGILLAGACICLCAGLLVSGCKRHPSANAQTPQVKAASLSPAATLGKQIFFDPSLSASGKLACGTCHDPRYAYGPANGLAVQLGGPELKDPGPRAVPSLRY